MADAPAPPPPRALPGTASPSPALTIADERLRKLVAEAMDRATATRAYLVERATETVATMTHTLSDLHALARLARDTATVIPGLHELAHVLGQMHARGHAAQADLEPEWTAAVDAAARANADATALVADKAGAARTELPPGFVRRGSPEQVRLVPSRKRPLNDDESDSDNTSDSDISGCSTCETDTNDTDSSDSDSSDANNEAQQQQRRRPPLPTSRTPAAGGGVPVRAIDAAVLKQLAKDDYGQLMCTATSKFEITQDRRETVLLRDFDADLNYCRYSKTRSARGKRACLDPTGTWNNALMASLGVTRQYARYCVLCGHAPYSTRTPCCDDWSHRPGTVNRDWVVFGVPRRRLQALIAVSNEHNTTTRAHLVARTTATVESMRRMLEDPHTLAVLAKDTATVVPGLHDLAVVLRAMDTQGIRAWRASLYTVARADADAVAIVASHEAAAARARNQVVESRTGATAAPAHVEVLDHAADDGDDKDDSGQDSRSESDDERVSGDTSSISSVHSDVPVDQER
ncbi:hypothetical protein GGF32_003610 [Allomyces javanicus]|nr:hypothetical protein GGF32_003610 [Allomyces javanicus]